MHNRVLWTIDNELGVSQFERLCTDLMFRTGYRDIVPVEPQDGGRDAEELPRHGRGRAGERCFFQYSMEADWKAKVRRDMRRVLAGGHRPSRFVFVTSRKARGVDVDAITKEAIEKCGWEVTVYSREWLRLQLEEAHPDLAVKYLGVGDDGGTRKWSSKYSGLPLNGDDAAHAWALFSDGSFDRAAVVLKDLLAADPDRGPLWEALAWSQYQLRRYDEALASINRAIALGGAPQALSIRACVLAERGIEQHDRASLLEAKEIFLWVAAQDGRGSWVDLYNLGNVLSALGLHAAAVEHYRQSLKLDPTVVEVWKNLASAYHRIGEHDEEMKCLDRALELDPLKPEALASKGVSLLLDFGDADGAVIQLEKALSVGDSDNVRWPHLWYWLAEAHHRRGAFEEALRWVDQGLLHEPGHRGLRRQKSDLLADLIHISGEWLSDAERFWKSALELEPLDYSVRERLIGARVALGDELAAWTLLDDCFTVFGMEGLPSLAPGSFSIDEVLTALEALPMYSRFREFRPIAAYWDTRDPLYVLSFEPPLSETIVPRLTAFLSVPFGLAFGELREVVQQEHAGKRRTLDVMKRHASRLGGVVTDAARDLAHLIPREGSPEAKSKPIADIVLFLGLLALREFTTQLGWLRAHLEWPEAAYEEALADFPFQDLEADVVSGCIVPLNDVAGFAPTER